jgi:hypothetical protein
VVNWGALEFLVGDCIPESCDGGKTWCVDYAYIQAHPEKNWKTIAEIARAEMARVENADNR